MSWSGERLVICMGGRYCDHYKGGVKPVVSRGWGIPWKPWFWKGDDVNEIQTNYPPNLCTENNQRLSHVSLRKDDRQSRRKKG